MAVVQQQATLHEKTVVGISTGAVRPSRRRRAQQAPRSNISRRQVHPAVMAAARAAAPEGTRLVLVDECTVYVVNRPHRVPPGSHGTRVV